MLQFSAYFDGKHLCPAEPVSLPRNVSLRITVDGISQSACTTDHEPLDVFDRLEDETGLIDGPADWSEEHDHYLTGAPKRTGESRE